MALTLSEDQLLLRETARGYLREKSPVSRMRALRDSEDATGFSRELWKEMAEMGWLGIPFPEDFGGAGMGFGELGVVMEECGRVLAPEPFLSTLLLGGQAVLLGGSEALRNDVLPAVCTGDRILAMAAQERGRFAPTAVATRAQKSGDAYWLSGAKQFVLDAHVADAMVVVARTGGGERDRDGLTLFLVDGDAAGLSTRRNLMVDGRNAGDVTFDGVVVGADRILGDVGAGADLLDAVFDRATACLAAEMLGTFTEAFERTLTYLKHREQFGVKIGTFQALRHRAADMWIEVELARSVVRDALGALDEGREDASQRVSAAKVRCSDTANLIAGEAVQMHGGIGMTDEEEIGLFFKRAKAGEMTLGDAIHHRDRFAALRGY